MYTTLLPYKDNDVFIVEASYDGGAKLTGRGPKLKYAISEAEGMERFGMKVVSRKILMNTNQIVKQGDTFKRVFNVLVAE